MTNFYHGAPAWRGKVDSAMGAETGEPTFEHEHSWLPLDHTASNSGLAAPYQFDITNDTPSLLQYAPLSSFYKFHFKINDLEKGKDVLFKIQVFQVKLPADNNKISTELPDYLGAYRNMCSEDPSDANKLSPYYHRKLHEQTFHVKNYTEATMDCEKYFNFKWNFANKLIRIDPTQINAIQTETQAYGASNHHKFVRPQDNLWMLLSTSSTNDAARNIEVSCMRTDRWRDNDGVITR